MPDYSFSRRRRIAFGRQHWLHRFPYRLVDAEGEAQMGLSFIIEMIPVHAEFDAKGTTLF